MNLLRILACLFLAAPALEAIENGQSEAALLSNLPAPTGKLSTGRKTIYSWPDREVVVVGGVVTEIHPKPSADHETKIQSDEDKLREKDLIIAELKARLAKEAAVSPREQKRVNPMLDMVARSEARQQVTARRNSLLANRRALEADIKNLQQQQPKGLTASENRRRNEIGQTIMAKQDAIRAIDQEIASLK